MEPNWGEKQWQAAFLTFPNSSTLISPSLSQSNKAKASFRQSMSLAVTCLSGLTLRAGGLAMGRRSSALGGGKPSTGLGTSTGLGLGCPLGPTRTGLGPADQLLLAATAENAASHPHSQRQAGYLSKVYPKPDSGNARNPFLVKCLEINLD